MQNFLGQIALERGNRAADSSRASEARERWLDAAGWLDASIGSSAGRWPISEGYGRKDRALIHLAESQIDEADAEAQQSRKSVSSRSLSLRVSPTSTGSWE